ncbi:MAG: hypothetical protein WA421_08405 [Nitrososphaeraceae archaeon]
MSIKELNKRLGNCIVCALDGTVSRLVVNRGKTPYRLSEMM